MVSCDSCPLMFSIIISMTLGKSYGCSSAIEVTWRIWVESTIARTKHNSTNHAHTSCHDDISKHLPRYWPFVRGIHLWPLDSLPKAQLRGKCWWRHHDRKYVHVLYFTHASDAELCVFLYQRLNKWSSKRARRRWFETPLHPLWRHFDGSSTTSRYVSLGRKHDYA